MHARLGRIRGMGALGLGLILSNGLTQGGLGGAVWSGQWAAQGFILAEVMNRSRSLNRAVGSAVLISLALQICLLGIWALQRAESPWSLLSQSMETAFRQGMELYGHGSMTTQESAKIKEGISRASSLVVVLLPGIFASTNLLLQWWTLLVCRRFPLIWARAKPAGPERLDEWGIPYPWVWVTILGGVLLLLPVEILGAVGVNLLIFMGSVHLLQGMAVVSNVFRQRRVPPFFRGVVYALVFLQQVFLLVVAAIGLFDLWFDFRKRWGGPTLRA